MRVFGFAGWSGSGKTTLIEQLIPHLVERGLVVSLIKHAHHAFDVDHPGKDSWRHRHAGCTEVLVSSRVRWALMHELRGQPEPPLECLLARLSHCDLVLVEGYKAARIPKLEVWRSVIGKALLHPSDPNIRAIATNDRGFFPESGTSAVPMLRLDDYDGIATLVLAEATVYPQPVDPLARGG